jgi:hypothetical protein
MLSPTQFEYTGPTKPSFGAKILDSIKQKAESICTRIKNVCGNYWKPVAAAVGVLAIAAGVTMSVLSWGGGIGPGIAVAGSGCAILGMVGFASYRNSGESEDGVPIENDPADYTYKLAAEDDPNHSYYHASTPEDQD